MKEFDELLFAIGKKDRKAVKRLLKAHPFLFHFECPHGWPVIHCCIEDPVNQSCLDLDLVKLYVENGGDVNQKTGGGLSLLFLGATHYDSKEIEDFPVSCGATMSAFEQVVAALAREEEQQQVNALVKRFTGEDAHIVRQTDYAGHTLLHSAVRHYAPEMVCSYFWNWEQTPRPLHTMAGHRLDCAEGPEMNMLRLENGCFQEEQDIHRVKNCAR